MAATDLPASNSVVSLSPVAFNPIKEAARQLEVCNSCRYCEGYCAVFPALERRRVFTPGDVDYLANLCHDCRACLYACMFAPPHQFAVNLPKALAEVRRETYARYAVPTAAAHALRASGWLLALIAAIAGALLAAGVIATGDPSRIVTVHEGPGAFYQVVPYLLMFAPALAVSVVGFVVLIAGGVRFWHATRGSFRDLLQPGRVIRGTADALGLRYLTGGGAGGCNYPDDQPSRSRYVFHMLVFYGFLAAIVSTTSAFIQQDLLGWLPPYPIASVPVVFGSLGGVAMLVGTIGLLYLKRRSDRTPADPVQIEMDYVLLWQLALVNFTGLLLLALRDSAAMGPILIAHLAIVFTFFLTMPYSKFAHFIYRYAALVQNRLESRS
ncbi:MAG: tricarballylate utilization 4Fe-4S protein TcuB [Chloroflexi bacterium]|nr:tricarballylate utilization 4Fe-4S protein TcuB [Chloroflexota bacterium]